MKSYLIRGSNYTFMFSKQDCSLFSIYVLNHTDSTCSYLGFQSGLLLSCYTNIMATEKKPHILVLLKTGWINFKCMTKLLFSRNRVSSELARTCLLVLVNKQLLTLAPSILQRGEMCGLVTEIMLIPLPQEYQKMSADYF